MMDKSNSRRDAMKKMAIGSTLIGSLSSMACNDAKAAVTEPVSKPKLKGNIKHSVSRWCYGNIPLEEFADICKDIGIESIELCNETEWPILTKAGLTCAMANAPAPGISLVDGFNDAKFHKALHELYVPLIDTVADAGLKQLIVFSGNRRGISDEEGMDNCARGLEPLLKQAEKRGVILSMEVFNSKRDHPDYQADNTPWTIALAEKTGSPNFKILYDIYHMQIMEGDVIATIKKHHKYFSHYHTAGVPGRNEIGDDQELYYPAIVRAIVETGYDGFLGQEFIPKAEDGIASLRQAIAICDV